MYNDAKLWCQVESFVLSRWMWNELSSLPVFLYKSKKHNTIHIPAAAYDLSGFLDKNKKQICCAKVFV